MMKRICSRNEAAAPQHRERGVILPVLAVISLAVITTLVILSLYVMNIKTRGFELRVEAERICRFIGLEPWNYYRGVTTFQQEVDSLQLKDVRLTWARLIMPTMPDDGTNFGCVPGATTCTMNYSTRFPENLYDGDHRFQTLQLQTVSGTRVECGTIPGDCLFEWDVDNLGATSPNQRYPSNFWLNGYHSGVVVGCELEGEVSNILTRMLPNLGKEISAKFVWSSVVTGTSKVPVSQTAAFDASPGLSIGVATEMSSWSGASSAGDNRFRFDFSVSGAPVYKTAFRGVYDPLLARGAVSSLEKAGFYQSSGSGAYAGGGGNILSIPAAMGNEQDEALTACLNPPVMVRNSFTGTLVELASRHGQLRNRTRISSLNPQHWNYSHTPGPLSQNLNRPTLIVNLGEDLRNRIFGLPFIFYDSGTQASGPGAVNKNGLIHLGNPTDSHHAMIAGQLRNCWHIYHSGATPGIEISPASSVGLLNQKFEDSVSGGAYETLTYARSDYGILDRWGCPTTAPCVSTPNPVLNAVEAVLMLGTTQMCPRGSVDTTYPGNYWPAQSSCPKRLNAVSVPELLPDLEGFLRFESADVDPALGGGSVFGAFVAPGAFPFSPASPSPSFPFGGAGTSAYVRHRPLIDPPTTVLLVTHRIVLGDDTAVNSPAYLERRALAAQVQRLNAAQRPVKVVFIPTTFEDQKGTDVAAFCQVVLRLSSGCVRDGTTPANAARNEFRLLSPWDQQYGTRYTAAPYVDPSNPQETILARYWADLLQFDPTVPDDLFIVTWAEKFFQASLMRHEPKL